jgi:hypothetical protein
MWQKSLLIDMGIFGQQAEMAKFTSLSFKSSCVVSNATKPFFQTIKKVVFSVLLLGILQIHISLQFLKKALKKF